MQSFQMKSKPGTGKAAFTLVEMLVVIAIISILMTAGSIGLSGMGGKGVTSGVASAESLFDEARTMAVGRNLRTCVLVAKTLDNNSEGDLRRVVIAAEPVDATTGIPTTTTGEPAWEIVGRGIMLPDQTFFSEKFSKKDSTGGGALETVNLSGASKSYQGDYFKYEFNAQGISMTPGASFIIGTGARNSTKPATQQPPKVMASAKRDFGGFVVWRNGRTSVFRSPEQMGSEVSSISSGSTF